MAKILHTADIHLKVGAHERWEALEEIIKTGKEEKIDLLIICGDLFDSKADASKLYGYIRELFSRTGYKVLILPGNHDAEVYTEGFFFGEDVYLFKTHQTPYKMTVKNGTITIWGMPYEPLNEIEVLERMTEISRQALNGDENSCHILAFHGELLETYYSGEDFGDEGPSHYMPVKKSNLSSLCFDYILAGHFHTHFRVFDLAEKAELEQFFVYPGSPVSVTGKETGQRKVNVFETGAPPREKTVNTFHRQVHEIKLNPFSDSILPANKIQQVIHEIKINTKARLILQIHGYFSSEAAGMNESQLKSFIDELCQEKLAECPNAYGYEIIPEFRDLGNILDDELYKSFERALENYDLNNTYKQKMREMVIDAMMEVKT